MTAATLFISNAFFKYGFLIRQAPCILRMNQRALLHHCNSSTRSDCCLMTPEQVIHLRLFGTLLLDCETDLGNSAVVLMTMY